MPLQKQNLYVLAPTTWKELSIDEFLGPTELRPGELHEPFPGEVADAFLSVASARGVPRALAVTVVTEFELVVANLGPFGSIGELNSRARVAGVKATRPLLADYIRTLMALCNGRSLDSHGEAAVVVPSRVADRLRATGYTPNFDAGSLDTALRWELAAASSGQTLSEWALTQTLQAAS